MSLYRVSCTLVSQRDDASNIDVSVTDKHPDLAKWQIERKYPGYMMTRIKIEDLNPTTQRWDGSRPAKSSGLRNSQSIDLDSTWRKELAK